MTMKTITAQHSKSPRVLFFFLMYMLISHSYWPHVNAMTIKVSTIEGTKPDFSSTTIDDFTETNVDTTISLETLLSTTSVQADENNLKMTTSFEETTSGPEDKTATTSVLKIHATFKKTSNPMETTDTISFSTTRCTRTKRPVKKPCLTKDKDFWDKLQIELKVDEGYVQEIYKDHNGVSYFGIGHKITRKEPEFHKPVGTKVGRKRIEEAYQSDMKKAIESCCSLFKDFQNLPEEVQLIILNMRFNLGDVGLTSFAKFRNAINSRDWNKAAKQMKHSRWYKQMTNRAKRLVDRMRSVPQDSDCQ